MLAMEEHERRRSKRTDIVFGSSREQAVTLAEPRRRYGVLARILFATVGYVAITHTHERVSFARRVFDFVAEARAQQDNEQWHLLVLEDLLRRSADEKRKRGFFFGRLVPQLLALVYYHVSWVLYVVAPSLSYALNADFEDHAEHEYMEFVAEHPELEEVPWKSELARDYGEYATVADLLRRIGLDERVHKEESLARLEAPRFHGNVPRSGDMSIS